MNARSACRSAPAASATRRVGAPRSAPAPARTCPSHPSSGLLHSRAELSEPATHALADHRLRAPQASGQLVVFGFLEHPPFDRAPLLSRQPLKLEQRSAAVRRRRPLLHALEVLVAEHERLEAQAPARPILDLTTADRVRH